MYTSNALYHDKETDKEEHVTTGASYSNHGDPKSCRRGSKPKLQRQVSVGKHEIADCMRSKIRTQLSTDEKKFLLAVERGDIPATKRMLAAAHIDKNCMDATGRTAIVIAIGNEDLTMISLLLQSGVHPRDALLHAIEKEFVEAVELLLDFEDQMLAEGKPHSWESLPTNMSMFSSDITPLILAAHHDHYEIIRLLLNKGAKLPMPHDIRCSCIECTTSRMKDSVHHSQSRMNAYRALASPSLISLTSKDPILSSFQLSWELRRLSFEEQELRNEYKELKKKCQMFATALLDHTRSSYELEILLNYDAKEPALQTKGRMHLNRLKLAVKLHQKEFVAHPNVQQLLACIWYEGLPGFRCKNIFFQLVDIFRIAIAFPFLSIFHILAPESKLGQFLCKPFIQFICHSASYLTFLVLLILAAQKKGAHDARKNEVPNVAEWFLLAWLCGMVKFEVMSMQGENVKEYIKDMWKVMDLGTCLLYIIVVILRLLAYFGVLKMTCYRNSAVLGCQCNELSIDAMVLSECLLAAANIFSCLRMVYIFSVSPYLGPMQVSLSRMVIAMVRFFLLFVLVLFAFACGLNQLLKYYAVLDRKVWTDKYCPINENITSNYANEDKECPPGFDNYLKFANLFETTQTLFWTVFGVIDMSQFKLANIESFTKYWGKLILGTYTVICNIILLNLLIAMLNNSYQLISDKEDTEWKFARSRLWISFFEDKCALPPPFNIIPTFKFFKRIFKSSRCCSCGESPIVNSEPEKEEQEQMKEQECRYEAVMRLLVRRYILASEGKTDSNNATEDDIHELKQDISSLRCELLEILNQKGFSAPSYCNAGLGGRKIRRRERSLLNDLDVETSRDCHVGLWPTQPYPYQQIFASVALPLLSHGQKNSSAKINAFALTALNKKRKKLFAVAPKHRSLTERRLSRAGYASTRASKSLDQPLHPEHSSYELAESKIISLTPATTYESLSSYSPEANATEAVYHGLPPPTISNKDL